MKVAFVVQRYGLEVNGGAELHCRLIAEHMSKYWDVEVITTCAVDYVTWKNEYKPGVEEINGVKIRRFSVNSPRRQWWFGLLSKMVFNGLHTKGIEISWMKAQGPYSTGLLSFIEKERNRYDYFIFFTYLFCTTFFGLPKVSIKSILVPTAEEAPPLSLKIFHELFNMPRAIIYSTYEEKRLVNRLFNNENIPNDIVGVGIDFPKDIDGLRFRKKFKISEDFILYIGRITVDKGCDKMFDYFIRYKKDHPGRLKLVLIGKAFMEIPEHPDIINLGFVSEEDKFDALRASKLLVMPSPYESLSMALLEAWLAERPVLVNKSCDVMNGQCKRSKGGLAYNNYKEFSENIDYLLANEDSGKAIGQQGKEYVLANYSWDVIERKYIEFIKRISK